MLPGRRAAVTCDDSDGARRAALPTCGEDDDVQGRAVRASSPGDHKTGRVDCLLRPVARARGLAGPGAFKGAAAGRVDVRAARTVLSARGPAGRPRRRPLRVDFRAGLVFICVCLYACRGASNRICDVVSWI